MNSIKSCLMRFSRLLRYLHDGRLSGLTSVSREEYRKEFVTGGKVALAFEKSWDARKFEIELYWKRAAYFWAFIAATFAGYFTLINSESYRKIDRFDHAEVYFVICIGFVLSCAWLFINRGSKTWQRHWEIHVDLLEDEVVGPLYKTVAVDKTYSVSKINEIVSFLFVGIWGLLAFKYLLDQDLLNVGFYRPNWLIIICTIFSMLAVYSMIFGHGRGRFTDRSVMMFRRKVSFENGK